MKKLPPFLGLFVLLAFAAAPSARAQYNPPPPPDQQEAPPMNPDQGAPPPDQQPPPMDQDQSAPPPDMQGAPPADDQGAPPPDAGAASDDAGGDVNFQTFYNDLSSEGSWVQTGNYGYAWQPDVQDPDWAPYQDGHWVYTDEGWTWVSGEPWGWATYHYGRWVNIEGEGWVWVPGYTWAPAWVSWRYGGGYCGWAPLPPDTFVGIDFGGIGLGFHIGGDCDTAYGIGPGWYHFLPVGYLGARDYHSYYVNRYNNYAIINNTRNVTNIVVHNQAGAGRFGRVTVGGPSLAAVNAQAHTPVQQVQLARSNSLGAAHLNGSRLAVYAPRVNAAGAGTAYRPHEVARTLSTVQINRGTSISQPLAATARLRPTAATAQQVQAARTAAKHVSRNAGVATATVHPTHALSQPLTTYRPHTSVGTEAAVHTSSAGANVHAQAGTVGAERTFTGEAPASHAAVENVPHETDHHASESAVQSHTAIESNTNAQAERMQQEQAQRAEAERTQAEHAQVEQHAAVQQAPVQHAAVEQHAAIQHAPEQHAAPQHAPEPHAAAHPAGADGAGHPDHDKDDKH